MLYLNSKNDIIYRAAEGFGTVIFQDGSVRVTSWDKMVAFNYRSIDEFETAIIQGDCGVYTLDMKSYRSPIVDKIVEGME